MLEKNEIINLFNNKNSSDVIIQNDGIDYSPPTEEEQQAGDEIKKEIVEENSQNETIRTAEVVIVDASQYGQEIEVRAFVSNIIQDGTCTVTFTKDTYTVTKNTPAYADASTTPCTTLTIMRSEFPTSGNWTVLVNYSNSEKTTTGSSSGEINIL